MERFRVKDGTVDLVRRTVERSGQQFRLTALDARLLEYLVRRSPRPVAREELLREVWGYGPGIRTEAVEQAVRRLRTKVEPVPSRPEHLLTDRGHGYRLVLAGGSDELPRTNVTAPTGPLVGRSGAAGALSGWLGDGHRLITITGLGGIGKTRLAHEIVWRWLVERPAAAGWLVDLAAARSPSDVATALPRTLELPVGPEALGDALAELGDVLLVLDNVEQVVGAIAERVPGWLEAATGLRVLCTSRERLGLLGEQVLELGPLDPDDAVALWTRRTAGRAAAAAADRETVLAITAHLDHIPLAIELAAARSATLAPRDVLASLTRGEAAGCRAAVDRHASMTACLRWSWDLLAEDERAVLGRCTVFRGGWSSAAAEEVLGEASDVLGRLVDRSMVRTRATVDGRTRFELFEVVARFLAARSRADGRARHATHYARMGAEESLQQLLVDPSHARAASLEVDNLRAALDWALRAQRIDLVARLATALGTQLVEQPVAALDQLASAFGLRPADPTHRVALALVQTRLLVKAHRLDEAHAVLDEVLALPVPADQRPRLWIRRATALNQQFRFQESRRHAQRVVREATGPHAAWHRACALQLLGECDARAGRIDDARRRYHEALLMNEEIGRHAATAQLRCGLGVVAFHEHAYTAARDHFEASIAAARSFSDMGGELHAQWRLSSTLAELGEPEQALACTERALALAQRLGRPHLLGYAHYGVGERLLASGQPARARDALARARQIALRHGQDRLLALVDAVDASQGVGSPSGRR